MLKFLLKVKCNRLIPLYKPMIVVSFLLKDIDNFLLDRLWPVAASPSSFSCYPNRTVPHSDVLRPKSDGLHLKKDSFCLVVTRWCLWIELPDLTRLEFCVFVSRSGYRQGYRNASWSIFQGPQKPRGFQILSVFDCIQLRRFLHQLLARHSWIVLSISCHMLPVAVARLP